MKYNNIKEKLQIICKKHGTFEQTGECHLKGCGCQMCAKEQLKSLKRMKSEIFIEKANKIHNNKYDYSKMEYVTNKIKIENRMIITV